MDEVRERNTEKPGPTTMRHRRTWFGYFPWRLLLAILLALGAVPTLRAQEALLAVIDKPASKLVGMSKDEHQYLVGKLYSWAERSLGRDLRVMTEENTITLLKDNGINLATCEGECDVETGRKLQADWLIVSRVLRFTEKDPFILTLRLYQVSNGTFHGEREVAAPTFMELCTRAETVASQIFSLLQEKLGRAMRVESAQVVFLLAPGPVFVQRDGMPIGRLSVPVSGRLKIATSPGPHTFVLSRDGQLDWTKQVDALAAEPLELAVTFVAGKAANPAPLSGLGFLRVSSAPSGATVFLDDVEVGTTTLQLEDIAAGPHRVRVEKPLYKPWQGEQVVESDGVADVAATLEPNFGALEIRSTPGQAMVYINGQQKGQTPYRLERFSAGSYQLRLSKPLYHDAEQAFTLLAGVDVNLELPLKPAFGALEVLSTPDGAEVWVDEESWGRTPAKRDTVLSGRHTVLVRRSLYNDYESTVQVEDGGQHKLTADLSADFGTLALSGTPAGAEVRIDGRLEGRLPCTLRLKPGSHQLAVSADTYLGQEETLVIAVGDTQNRSLNLVRQTGGLRVFVQPPDARIWLDGKLLGPSPQVLKELPTGSYEVRAALDSYADHTERVVVREGEPARLDISLSKTAWLEWKTRRNRTLWGSAAFPGLGQLLARNNRGLLYTLSCAGGIWLGVESWRRFENADHDFQTAQALYESSMVQGDMDRYHKATDESWQEMQDQRRLNQAGVGLAIAAWSAGVLDAWFFGGGSRDTGSERAALGATSSTWHLGVAPLSTAPGVSLRINW
jgi:hypothetical protein